jgi:hypothetical protein
MIFRRLKKYLNISGAVQYKSRLIIICQNRYTTNILQTGHLSFGEGLIAFLSAQPGKKVQCGVSKMKAVSVSVYAQRGRVFHRAGLPLFFFFYKHWLFNSDKFHGIYLFFYNFILNIIIK